jgi:hypothetical protein
MPLRARRGSTEGWSGCHAEHRRQWIADAHAPQAFEKFAKQLGHAVVERLTEITILENAFLRHLSTHADPSKIYSALVDLSVLPVDMVTFLRPIAADVVAYDLDEIDTGDGGTAISD